MTNGLVGQREVAKTGVDRPYPAARLPAVRLVVAVRKCGCGKFLGYTDQIKLLPCDSGESEIETTGLCVVCADRFVREWVEDR